MQQFLAVNRTTWQSEESALLDHLAGNGGQASSVKLNVAHTRPPCASIMDRQIDSRMPMPLGFVVRNGLNSLSGISGSMPLREPRLNRQGLLNELKDGAEIQGVALSNPEPVLSVRTK